MSGAERAANECFPEGTQWSNAGLRSAFVRGAKWQARQVRIPDRLAIADEISGIQVGSGYESVTIGIAAALEAADAILAYINKESTNV